MQKTNTFADHIQNHSIIPNLNLGIEVRLNNYSFAEELFSQHFIKHIQISAPQSDSPEDYRLISNSIPTYIHSSFLNVLGENNWQDLAKVARQLRSLSPICIVDHFGTLVDHQKKKYAVHFDTQAGPLKLIKQAVENIKRWQDLVSTPIAIENIPVITGTAEYFELFETVAEKAGSRTTIDIPHLLISTCTQNYDGLNAAIKYLKQLNPDQIHISGLSVRRNSIEDNHHAISLWLLNLINEAQVHPETITIEQSEAVSVNLLEQAISRIRSNNFGQTPSLVKQYSSKAESQFSHDLAEERARGFGIQSANRFPSILFNEDEAGICQQMERAYPFMYPISSLIANSPSMTIGDIVESVSSLLTCAQGYGHWFDRDKECFFIHCETENKSFWLDFGNETLNIDTPSNVNKIAVFTSISGDKVSLFTRKLPIQERGRNV
jgi:uncharacterized protein (UPF0276 family)